MVCIQNIPEKRQESFEIFNTDSTNKNKNKENDQRDFKFRVKNRISLFYERTIETRYLF